MLPEILMLCLLTLNQIHLRLIGLYFLIEQDIETIEDAIQRNILKGDSQAVKEKKLQSANMILRDFFRSLKDQMKDLQVYLEEKKK